VLVQRARYGRMNLSKCVRENFGYIGCSNDVIDIVDSHCSGRRTCSLRVLDENFMNMKPCHEDLKLYLSVQYSCVEGTFCGRIHGGATRRTGMLGSIEFGTTKP